MHAVAEQIHDGDESGARRIRGFQEMQQHRAGAGCEQKAAATRGEDSYARRRCRLLEMQLASLDAAGAFPLMETVRLVTQWLHNIQQPVRILYISKIGRAHV